MLTLGSMLCQLTAMAWQTFSIAVSFQYKKSDKNILTSSKDSVFTPQVVQFVGFSGSTNCLHRREIWLEIVPQENVCNFLLFQYFLIGRFSFESL
jgi:hypothetical protein